MQYELIAGNEFEEQESGANDHKNQPRDKAATRGWGKEEEGGYRLRQGQCDIPGKDAKIRVPAIMAYAYYKGCYCAEDHDPRGTKVLFQKMDDIHLSGFGKNNRIPFKSAAGFRTA